MLLWPPERKPLLRLVKWQEGGTHKNIPNCTSATGAPYLKWHLHLQSKMCPFLLVSSLKPDLGRKQIINQPPLEERDTEVGKEEGPCSSLPLGPSAHPQLTLAVIRNKFGIWINVWSWTIVHKTFYYLRVRNKVMGLDQDQDFIQEQRKIFPQSQRYNKSCSFIKSCGWYLLNHGCWKQTLIEFLFLQLVGNVVLVKFFADRIGVLQRNRTNRKHTHAPAHTHMHTDTHIS